MKAFILNLVEKNDFQSVRLLNILREIQKEFHFISKDAIEIVADLLKIERTQIISVIEFYSFFHLEPRGQYDILLSDSITDHMMGKQSLMTYFSEQLGVTVGNIRSDGIVSLNNTSCTGMCDQGPAALVNGYALTHLNKKELMKLSI
jgi:[NiFe] hydrogenase diaphorase moiety large subunit